MERSESLLREAGNRSEYLRPREFVALAERYAEGTTAGADPGVPREWLLAHVEALAGESHVDAESFRSSPSEVTTDAETWTDDRAVYEVGEGRLSAYPPAWHEALEDCRADGRLIEDADQHPEANVYLPHSEHERDASPE